jgi:hypothetical protein
MLAAIFPWAAKRPSLVSIILALMLLGLGQLFRAYGVLGPLADFTAYLERSLQSFDAPNIGSTFYRELTGCGYENGAIACAPGPDTYERLQDTLEGTRENGLLGSILVAVIMTVTIVFGQATWLGILIYLIALIAAAWMIAAVLDLEESGPAGIVLTIVLTPAVASIAALALKWLLLLFILMFSQVLAGIVWFLATFGAFIGWAQMGNAVLSNAHQLDTAASTVKSDPPSASPPAAK